MTESDDDYYDGYNHHLAMFSLIVTDDTSFLFRKRKGPVTVPPMPSDDETNNDIEMVDESSMYY